MANFSQHAYHPPPDMPILSPTYSQTSSRSNSHSYDTMMGSQRGNCEVKPIRKSSSRFEIGAIFKRNSIEKKAKADAQFLAQAQQQAQAFNQAAQAQSDSNASSHTHSHQPTQMQGQIKEEKPAPKRRGPKPDSKPALNRRQELNRQAQRTHRERKELYAKSLENNNIQLKEQLANVARQRDALASENNILKELLRVNDIPYHASPSTVDVFSQDNGYLTGGATAPNGTLNGAAVNFGAAPNATSTTAAQVNGLRQTSVAYSESNHTASPNNGLPGEISPAMTAMSLNPQSSTTASLNGGQAARHSPAGDVSHSLVRNDTASSAFTGSTMYSDGGSYVPTSTAVVYSQAIANANTAMAMANSNDYNSPAFDHSIKEFELQNGTQREMLGVQASLNAGFSNQAPVYGAPGIDHDKWASDLIVDLEASCKDHAKLMYQRGAAPGSTELSGHAMMMTCPPHSFIMKSLTNPDMVYPNQLPNMPQQDLNVMLNSAAMSDNGGEVTPVQALVMIRNDQRYSLFERTDLENLKGLLKERSRCYGFGAMVEEYEVRDALNAVVNHKFGQSALPTNDGYSISQSSTAMDNIISTAAINAYVPSTAPATTNTFPFNQGFAKRTSSLGDRFGGPAQAVPGANMHGNGNGHGHGHGSYNDAVFSGAYP